MIEWSLSARRTSGVRARFRLVARSLEEFLAHFFLDTFLLLFIDRISGGGNLVLFVVRGRAIF